MKIVGFQYLMQANRLIWVLDLAAAVVWCLCKAWNIDAWLISLPQFSWCYTWQWLALTQHSQVERAQEWETNLGSNSDFPPLGKLLSFCSLLICQMTARRQWYSAESRPLVMLVSFSPKRDLEGSYFLFQASLMFSVMVIKKGKAFYEKILCYELPHF